MNLILSVFIFEAYPFAMFNKPILGICLILSAGRLFSQDSLVMINEISYSSAAERAAIRAALVDKKPDYFSLFNYANQAKNEQSKAKFYAYLRGLDLENKGGKKNSKRVKYVFENVHQAFLTKYQAKNLFSEIFDSGYYNCVSATALYSMAFDYFDIPYVIKEKPNHVYPVAYPQSDLVVVETTNPMVGSIAFSDQFKRSYVENLRKQKLVSNQEARNTDPTQLFDQYFFRAETTITLDQLVGIQYMNNGIFKFEDDDFISAFQFWEKAYLFYKTDQVINGLVVSYYNAFQNLTKKDSLHASLVGKLSRFTNFGVAPDNVKGELGRAIQELLFNRGKPEEIDRYYQVLNTSVRGQELKEDLEFIYKYELGRYLFNQGKFTDSKPHFERAFELRPNNQDVQRIYIQLLASSLIRGSSNIKEVLNSLQDAGSRHPSLTSNNVFNSMLASSYLNYFGQLYEENKPGEGDKYKTEFEKLYTTNKDLTIEPTLIGQAYSQAAVFYFKKSQLAKAKSLIEKGLEFDPGNRELLARKRLIN
jgi:tetratricopeptide (TPR) repeat protein